jgi:tRNA nucleotidyltransferase (CCA-adding enzyme)
MEKTNEDFIDVICKSGGEVYVVGGAIRNIIYNRLFNANLAVKDCDLLIRGMKQEDIIEPLKKFGKVKEVGHKFGVIKFSNDEFKELDIALPRTEISTGPGYKDFKIIADHKLSLEEDFKRRDATINAMAIQIYNTENMNMINESIDLSKLLDPYGGFDDLKNRTWKAVGDAYKRFVEDPTRIMRALRQCSELGLDLDPDTKQSILTNFRLLTEIMNESIVRITEELVRMLNGNFSKMIDFMFVSGIANLLGLPKDGLNKVLKCTNENSNLRIRVACLLSSDDNKDAINWIKKFELSAAPHYSKNDVAFIKCISSLSGMTRDVCQNTNNTFVDNIKMRKLLQATEKLCPNYGVEYVHDMIRYVCLLDNIDFAPFISLYERNKGILLSPNNLMLDGNTIMDVYGLSGSKIKELKLKLFDLVTEDIIENDKNELVKFINNNMNMLHS